MAGDLVTRDVEKAEMLNAFFCLPFQRVGLALRVPRSLSLLAESVGVKQYPQ